MHIMKLIERRFPEQKARVVPLMVFLYIGILLLEIGLIFIQ